MFLVLLKPAKPMSCLRRAVSGSESSSIGSPGAGAGAEAEAGAEAGGRGGGAVFSLEAGLVAVVMEEGFVDGVVVEEGLEDLEGGSSAIGSEEEVVVVVVEVVEALGPLGGSLDADVEVGVDGGGRESLAEEGGFVDVRGGERILVAVVPLRAGERERERLRSE